jgi:hypothetical protein
VKQAMYRKGYDLGQVDDWLRDNGYGRWCLLKW